jgi:hypothetical protein
MYHVLNTRISNPQTQSPMLSNYLQNTATVLERITNHIPPEPAIEAVKKTRQVLRDVDPALTQGGEKRDSNNGSVS